MQAKAEIFASEDLDRRAFCGDRSNNQIHFLYEDSKVGREEGESEEGHDLATYIVLTHVTLASVGVTDVWR